MLAKIVYAGTNNPSFEQGSQDLAELADLTVSPKQVERVSERIGSERCVERDQEVAAYIALPLVERKSVPAGVTAPELAVVGVDGGRLQIRDAETEEPPGESAAGSDNPTRGKHWREDKIGLLLTMASAPATSDPCPEIPESFVNGAWLLVRELFGWRTIQNRRQLAALVGLVPTPYQSGDSAQEQGISKAGNRRLRRMLVELAWCWVRWSAAEWLESLVSGPVQHRSAGTQGRHRGRGAEAADRVLALPGTG